MKKRGSIILFLCLNIFFQFFVNRKLYSQVTQIAVIACVSAHWDCGAHSIVSVDPIGGSRQYKNNLLPTHCSDLSIVAYENFFYRIERFNADNVTKFSINAPDKPIWQYSTKDEKDRVSSTNPYDIIFASSNKAYLLRYNTPIAWIINPSATCDAEFKIGELDLTSYTDQDNFCPEMTSGVIVNNKLFILLQRLDQSDKWIPKTAYLAVFDTRTDREINTNISNPDQVLGIPLPIKNPSGIQYLSETNTIYIQGVGRYEASWAGIPADYSGGIVTVNPITYDASIILDDGDNSYHPYGNISGMAIISANKGYFIGYKDWEDNTLYSFNPSTGDVYGSITNNLNNKNIASLENGAYGDKNGMLWVCNASDAEVIILNTNDDTIDEIITTNLNPQKVVFVNFDEVYDDSEGTKSSLSSQEIFLSDPKDNENEGCFINLLHLI